MVWILEDSALEGEMARQALAHTFAVRLFTDGEALIEQLSLSAPPDVLVLDWNLPRMSGIEVCRFIRQTRDELTLPVLIFTSTMPPESIVEALKEGANDFVPKPYFPEELRARVSTLARVRMLAKEAAQQAVFERQLIGIVSHDLRNPLSAILLAAKVMSRQPNIDPQTERMVNRILSSGSRCGRLISDILDFSLARGSRGLPINPAPADLSKLVRQAVEECALANPDRRIEIDCPEQCDGSWDGERVSQVIANLLGNALQYSPPQAPVRVSVASSAHEASISVHNEGPPISPETEARMFKPMERGSTQQYSAGRSVGLGLFIVDHIMKAHGGRVTVHSSEKDGTTFTATLPLDTHVAPGAELDPKGEANHTRGPTGSRASF